MQEDIKDLKNMIADGAIVVDVHTPAEYAEEHMDGSLNIPLADINNYMSELKKDKPIIFCCASGERSEIAKKILQANEFEKVYNGGSCSDLKDVL